MAANLLAPPRTQLHHLPSVRRPPAAFGSSFPILRRARLRLSRIFATASSPGDSERRPRVTDEWGEPTEARGEEPSEPDPPVAEDDDEWGKDAQSIDDGNGTSSTPPKYGDDNLSQLKRCLVDTLYGTELGFRASAETRAEIFELVAQLEAENPNPAPNEKLELLDGKWILLFTAYAELFPIVAIANTPVLKVKDITQTIDSKALTIVNATTLTSPGASISFSALASFEVQSPSRVQVLIKEGRFNSPEVSSTVDIPDNVDIFGQKIDLSPIQRSLNPIQEAVANITNSIFGQRTLKVPIPGDRPKSWLLTTYLDDDFRISRGDGGLFILAKEGSPLLDQLS